MEQLHAVGHQGLHHGHTGGEGGKAQHQEEGCTHQAAHQAHGLEHLGQGDKGQAGAKGHALGAQKDIDGGDDHHTGEKGGGGVEDFDLVCGLAQVHIVLHIGTIGDHNAHGHAEREEQLAHSVQQNLEKALYRQPLQIGQKIDPQTLQAGAGDAVLPLIGQGEGENGDAHDEQQQAGHEDAGIALDALLHAAVDHKGGEGQKDQGEHDGGHRGGDEAGEIAVLGGCGAVGGEIGGEIL